MFYLKIPFLANGGNNVKTDGGINAVMLYISICGNNDTSHFLPVDGILRLDKVRVATGFHFYHNQFSVFGCDDIQFQMFFRQLRSRMV